jgi:hypothetical protein
LKQRGVHNIYFSNSESDCRISNALNGYGVLRFSRAAATYLDINPVAYLNQINSCVVLVQAAAASFHALCCSYAIFLVVRLSDTTPSNVQYVISTVIEYLECFAHIYILRYIVTDSSGGMGVFFDGNRWCVQSTSGSGIGCSTKGGDGSYHVIALIFDGSRVGDSARTTFRFDMASLPLTFAGSQDISTGAFTMRFELPCRHNTPGRLIFEVDLGKIIKFRECYER